MGQLYERLHATVTYSRSLSTFTSVEESFVGYLTLDFVQPAPDD